MGTTDIELECKRSTCIPRKNNQENNQACMRDNFFRGLVYEFTCEV